MAKQKDGAGPAAHSRPAAGEGEDAGELTMRSASGSGRPRPVAVAAPTQVDHAAITTAVTAAMAALQTQKTVMAPTKNLDKTVVGGCYLVDGVFVNAHNEIVADPNEESAKDRDEWMDQQAEARQGELVPPVVEEDEEEVELTEDQKKAQALNEARSKAADELRKRAESIADQAAKKKE